MRIFLLLLLIIGVSASAQVTRYYGGIYNDTLYFNWEAHPDSVACLFTVEESCDGSDYDSVYSQMAYPAPITLGYGTKIRACNSVMVRLRMSNKYKNIVFLPEVFLDRKYTYVLKQVSLQSK